MRSSNVEPPEQIGFDVLLWSAGSGAGDEPTLGTIAKFRPAPERVEKCRRWFADQGIDCYATAPGLACRCSPELFEAVFGTPVSKGRSGTWLARDEPKPPESLADDIEQITLASSPVLFP